MCRSRRFYDSGVVHKADTLRDLADAIGVKADTLVATIDRFNGFARTGKDEDFGRGDSAYDRYYGDPTMKNPCLDEIVEGPFYAIRCEAGDLGTKGGLVTDATRGCSARTVPSSTACTPPATRRVGDGQRIRRCGRDHRSRHGVRLHRRAARRRREWQSVPGHTTALTCGRGGVMLSDAQRLSAAHLLRNAEHGRAPIDPLTTVFPGIDVVDAYEIALINIRARREAGETVYGHKVGLSSEVMQKMMGVDEPDYGHLLSSMVYAEGTPIDTARFCYPRIEVEIGYVLGETAGGGMHRGGRAGGHRIHRSQHRTDRLPHHRLEDRTRRHDRRQRVLGRGDPRCRTGGTGERRHRRDLRRAVPR